jgi:hypothetical protein
MGRHADDAVSGSPDYCARFADHPGAIRPARIVDTSSIPLPDSHVPC